MGHLLQPTIRQPPSQGFRNAICWATFSAHSSCLAFGARERPCTATCGAGTREMTGPGAGAGTSGSGAGTGAGAGTSGSDAGADAGADADADAGTGAGAGAGAEACEGALFEALPLALLS